MLADALQSLHHFVFNENGENKSDDEIVKQLETVQQEFNVNGEIVLMQYLNLFSKLKIEILEKELKDKNLKTINSENGGEIEEKPKRGGKDWMPAERKILWFYINQAQEIEGISYGEAEKNLSLLLDKTPDGVRYKYYSIKKRVDKGENLEEVLEQARKSKKSGVSKTGQSKELVTGNATASQVPGVVKRGRGRPRKNPENPIVKPVVTTPEKPATVLESNSNHIDLPETKEVVSPIQEVVVLQPKEENISSVPEISVTQTTVKESIIPQAQERSIVSLEDTTPKNAVEELETNSTQGALSDNYQNEYVTYNVNKPKASDRSIFQILSSLINNFRVIGEEAEDLSAKEELTNLLIGLETLSIMAASNVHNDNQQQQYEKRIAELEAALSKEQEDYQVLARAQRMLVEEYERKAEQRNRAVEEAFKVFKNTHKHFFSLPEDRQILEFLDYKERVMYQLSSMEEAINKDKEQLRNTNNQTSKRFLVDIKDGLLKTV